MVRLLVLIFSFFFFIRSAGKSRYPGLYIWLRNGKKYRVVVPDGCLLLQAGKQLEWLTGGYITAGFHEVVVTADTVRVIKEVRCVLRPCLTNHKQNNSARC